jgi:hypothetical protein
VKKDSDLLRLVTSVSNDHEPKGHGEDMIIIRGNKCKILK